MATSNNNVNFNSDFMNYRTGQLESGINLKEIKKLEVFCSLPKCNERATIVISNNIEMSADMFLFLKKYLDDWSKTSHNKHVKK